VQRFPTGRRPRTRPHTVIQAVGLGSSCLPDSLKSPNAGQNLGPTIGYPPRFALPQRLKETPEPDGQGQYADKYVCHAVLRFHAASTYAKTIRLFRWR